LPLIRVKDGTKNKTWITAGITTSCKHKRELYLASRKSTDLRLKNHYKRYCNILSKVIGESKRYDHNSQILKSNNKTKTIWEIIKLETGKRKNNKEVPPIYAWVFQVVSFPQVSPLKPCMHLSSPPYVPHVLPISVFLT
jgi:hypothetical protein